jgi:hypothetical protein
MIHTGQWLPTVFLRTPAYAQLLLSLTLPHKQKNENFISSGFFLQVFISFQRLNSLSG